MRGCYGLFVLLCTGVSLVTALPDLPLGPGGTYPYLVVPGTTTSDKLTFVNSAGTSLATVDGTGNTNIAGLLTPSGGIAFTWTVFTTVISAATTAPAVGTGSTSVSYYMVMGKMLFVHFYLINVNAGSAGSGTYLFSLPPGFTMNTTVTGLYNSANTGLYPTIGTASTQATPAVAVAYTSTQYALQATSTTGTSNGPAFVGSGFYTLAGATTYTAHLQVPIV